MIVNFGDNVSNRLRHDALRAEFLPACGASSLCSNIAIQTNGDDASGPGGGVADDRRSLEAWAIRGESTGHRYAVPIESGGQFASVDGQSVREHQDMAQVVGLQLFHQSGSKRADVSVWGDICYREACTPVGKLDGGGHDIVSNGAAENGSRG